jgi:hypothetical protein
VIELLKWLENILLKKKNKEYQNIISLRWQIAELEQKIAAAKREQQKEQ